MSMALYTVPLLLRAGGLSSSSASSSRELHLANDVESPISKKKNAISKFFF